MSKRPIRYRYGDSIRAGRDLLVIQLPADQWGYIAQVYPELQRLVPKVLGGAERVVIHPATYYNAQLLTAFADSLPRAAAEYKDRTYVIRRDERRAVVAFATAIYSNGGIDVYIHRLERRR